MIKSEFSARLEKLLAMTGDSMRDLAQKCDIPYSTIRGYVAGDSLPNGIEQLQKIAHATGVCPAWLLGEETGQSQDSERVKRELGLLMTLAEHLSDEQRGIFIKKMLNALLYQVEGVERTSDEERKMLSASSIELALKINKLPINKQLAIYHDYNLDDD